MDSVGCEKTAALDSIRGAGGILDEFGEENAW